MNELGRFCKQMDPRILLLPKSKVLRKKVHDDNAMMEEIKDRDKMRNNFWVPVSTAVSLTGELMIINYY